MNILVTGANGFIGKHVCAFLEAQEGYKVFKVARKFGKKDPGNIELDLTQKARAISFFKEFKNKYAVDVVIHLAAHMAGGKQGMVEQFKLLESNLRITRNLVLVTKMLAPRKLINFSSMAVYPNVDGVFNEESHVGMSGNSDCLYGLAKYCSENIFDHFLKGENIVVTHLRISQVYGQGMDKTRIMPIMQQELKQRNTITVFGNGERTSNFIKVDKLSGIIKWFIMAELGGVYNVGEEGISYLKLAQKMIKEQGNESSRIIKNAQGPSTKFALDTSKLRSAMKGLRKKAYS